MPHRDARAVTEPADTLAAWRGETDAALVALARVEEPIRQVIAPGPPPGADDETASAFAPGACTASMRRPRSRTRLSSIVMSGEGGCAATDSTRPPVLRISARAAIARAMAANADPWPDATGIDTTAALDRSIADAVHAWWGGR